MPDSYQVKPLESYPSEKRAPLGFLLYHVSRTQPLLLRLQVYTDLTTSARHELQVAISEHSFLRAAGLVSLLLRLLVSSVTPTEHKDTTPTDVAYKIHR